MAISAIQPVSVMSPNFTAKHFGKDGYENPINRKTERNLSVLSTLGASALIGATGYGLASCLGKGWKFSGVIGGLAAAITLGLTLPSRLKKTYSKTNVKEKEINIYKKANEEERGKLKEQYMQMALAKNKVPDFINLNRR